MELRSRKGVQRVISNSERIKGMQLASAIIGVPCAMVSEFFLIEYVRYIISNFRPIKEMLQVRTVMVLPSIQEREFR
jgi:hypothetical protein